MNPTDEQVKELWGRCGLKLIDDGIPAMPNLGFHWENDSGDWVFNTSETPEINLPNLFKYAVEPKLTSMQLTWVDDCDYRAETSIWYREATAHDEDPALALFWAIYKVMGEKK